jgi:hypothetical protein
LPLWLPAILPSFASNTGSPKPINCHGWPRPLTNSRRWPNGSGLLWTISICAPTERLILAIDATLGLCVEERADLPTFHDRASAAVEARAAQQRRSRSAAQLLLRDMVAPIFLLVALQHVIVNALDLDTIYLRMTSFVVPFAFGLLSGWHTRRDLLASLAMGTGIGLLAVAAMTIVTGLSSGQQILPATAFEWRESIEYAVSIAASFFAGCLAVRLKLSLPGKKAG